LSTKPKKGIPSTPAEFVLDQTLPVIARLVMMQTTGGRTMVMGTLLSDLCPDSHERLLTAYLVVTPIQLLRTKKRNAFGGATITQIALQHLNDRPEDCPDLWAVEAIPQPTMRSPVKKPAKKPAKKRK